VRSSSCQSIHDGRLATHGCRPLSGRLAEQVEKPKREKMMAPARLDSSIRAIGLRVTINTLKSRLRSTFMAYRSVALRHQIAAILFALLPLAAAAGKFTSVTPSPDTGDTKSRLTITISDGTRFNAPKDVGQVGYENSYVSPDGRYVGWLDMYPLPGADFNYPIPGPLVVLDLSRKPHYFGEHNSQSIFQWCFVPNVAEVAYMSGTLHFSDAATFYLQRISDGRLLATYDFPDSKEKTARASARKHAPAWMRCVLKQEAANYASMWKH
jgi:hypothetical protein